MSDSLRREHKTWQLLKIAISLLPIFGKSFNRDFSPPSTILVSPHWSSKGNNMILLGLLKKL
ncbi:hypothetical protein A7K93_02590 [Candidatus Methylacidiphilum fumarolicum]|nr:hypothetical protein A7K73_00615 [Candidatus Methylacidiphilum fumarolicum]TFE73502.1 hypothetical protein A7K72_06255 [Candidatus Methylacidiphilum fumarolicum]TFE75035.1 hypothetical protein A7K93_02590 [Candidatus Methylacidiphilum fumarolicum]TFE76583.1 hypothetical protein A7D33_09595 [Candidatus Methylacidiphilum fumarolicum]